MFAAVVVLVAASCTKGSAPGSNLDVPDPEGTLEVNRRNFKVDGNNAVFDLTIGTYTVRAEKLSVTVTVSL